ncbi:hypothetical protein ACFYWU_37865 [Streptomyces chrestomyceticus]|uniref:hypothetical protein n=1 Tax=Streptomyces chrestomyceticus TaxID=68185 RepID=UPI00369014AF
MRSRDRNVPEERNRVLIDHLADVLCAAACRTPHTASRCSARAASPRTATCWPPSTAPRTPTTPPRCARS